MSFTLQSGFMIHARNARDKRRFSRSEASVSIPHVLCTLCSLYLQSPADEKCMNEVKSLQNVVQIDYVVFSVK